MKRFGLSVAVIGGLCFACSPAAAEWRQAFRTVADTKIHAYQADDVVPGRVLLGAEGGILESKDDGRTWKRVLTVPASQAIRVLRQEAGGARWWAATGRALYQSVDGGRHWEPLVQFADPENPIRCFAFTDSGLYAGRSAGLEVSLDGGTHWMKVPVLSDQTIHQIECDIQGRVWVAATRGIYRQSGSGSWEHLYRRLSVSDEEPESDSGGASDADGSEVPPGGGADGLYFWFASGEDVHVADGNKKIMLHGSGGEVRSDGMMADALLAPPSGIAGSPGTAAMAFWDGIRLSDPSRQEWRKLDSGWPGARARALVYEAAGDRLVAVTERGVFEYEHPDLNSYLDARLGSGLQKARVLTDKFAHEPDILELQNAAMRYAEVHPEKIIAWRRLAARRAWLPSLTVGQDRSLDQSVDIDRGGTGDADRFIQGPAEEDLQWSVDLSWDLGDLIWSDDQTTIDNRSKLMVQLRDEILTQLNQLYFARRRLQIAALIEGDSGSQKEADRILQIDEYTAGLDALTGGYFSRSADRGAEIKIGPDGVIELA